MFGTLRLFMMTTNLFVIANVKQQYGGHANLFCSHRCDSYNLGATAARNLKFGVETDHERAHTFY